MGSPLYHLSDKRALRESTSGGKAANLARLVRKGFRVPPGFVIPTGVFADLLKKQNAVFPPAPQDAARLRAAFLEAEFPPHVEEAIKKAFCELGGPAAVRSSMVGEDSTYASFSGQLETLLNVDNEEGLMRAVRNCYASAFGGRLLEYLRGHAARGSTDALGETSMAVLVQRMLNPHAAGVAFSADPDTGRFCIIIEAVRGLGESAASGRGRPDRYIVESGTDIVQRSLPDQGSPVLDDESITQLAEVIVAVSREMTLPQDIEWALDDGGFAILQTRPITSLYGKNVYSRKLARDMAPGLIKPLYFSTNIVGMTTNVFGPVFTAVLGARDIDYTDLVRLIRSRVFANATLFAKLFGEMGMPVNLFEVIARDESAVHKRPKMSARLMTRMLGLLSFVFKNAFIAGRARDFVARHEARLDHYRSADWHGRPADEVLDEVHRLRESHGETQYYMWITAVNMFVRNKMLSSFVRKRAPGVDSGKLIAGYSGLKSLEPHAEMRSIAGFLTANASDAIDLIKAGDPDTIVTHLESTEAGRVALKRFEAFMERYGYLSTSATDFTVPPWIENPGFIWRSIAAMTGEHDEEGESVNVRAEREAARLAVEQNLNPLSRFMFSRLLSSTIAYLNLRERISFLMSEDAYQMRRLYLALGSSLRWDGRLESDTDIFFLNFDELVELAEGRLASGEAKKAIAARRAALEEDADAEVPDVICGEEGAAREVPLPENIEYLRGIPGSAGRVRGRARIVRDPSTLSQAFTRDDILIVPFMDTGWTPLFASIGGIVAEAGGQLSHSAIVAREYGLPAVVSVERATRIINDDDLITIDGSTGRVYLGHVDEGGG
jgi:pyruvate,water dikinase